MANSKITRTGPNVDGAPQYITIEEINIDIAAMGATEIVGPEDLSGFHILSCQAVFSGVTGTTDGGLLIQTSIDGTNFDDITAAAATINAANGSQTITVVDCGGQFVQLEISKNNMTGGTITVYWEFKRKG